MKYFKIIAGCFFVLLLTVVPAGGSAPPENGIMREFHPDGNIRLELRYKKGLLTRKRIWYKNGRLKLDYIYRGGQPCAKRDYYENGRLKSIWTRRSRTIRFYRQDGTLKDEITSRSDGIYY